MLPSPSSKLLPRLVAALCVAAAAAAVITPFARAVDFANGEMTAVPVKEGKPPVIDGDLGDWDLSTQEPVFVSAQTADTMNAEWAVMYDNDALYLSAKVALPGRAIYSPFNPQDAFWGGDILQVRMSSDPSLGYPLDSNRDKASERVVHISFWQNSLTGKGFINISHGTTLKLGQTNMPAGAEVSFKSDGKTNYVMEAKIPWSALSVPDGKNPFKPGQSSAFTAETLWIGGDKSRTLLDYRRNPGVFAFHSPDAWGKLVYAAHSPGKRVRPPLAELIAAAKSGLTADAPKVGVPFAVDVPGDGLEVSVNIQDANGGVVRELVGGEKHLKGKFEVRWDGRDAFGKPVAPGTYKWAAYFHQPLVADYQGGVGSSGDPFYSTFDGKGAWGGDHSNPIDTAAEGNFLYMLWPVAEAGKPLIKTDLDGKVVWRKNPFVGGGFGPYYAVAATNKYVFLIRGSDQDSLMPDLTMGKTTANLVRLDAESGSLLTWSAGGPSEVPVCESGYSLVPQDSTPYELSPGKKGAPYPAGMTRQPDCTGLAASSHAVFISSYMLGKIFVVDPETGKTIGELACPGARGLALDKAGDLFAVSFVPGKSAQVVKFVQAAGAATPVISADLEAPYDVAVDAEGRLAVTDLGQSKQVKVFDATGKLVRTIGVKGGRPWQGKYDPAALAFLQPAGLSIDAQGAIVVAESAPPKVISRIALADGKLLNRWYGAGVYWNATWPMPDDPLHVFYLDTGAVARGRVEGPGKVGVPDAYWKPERAGYPQVGDLEDRIPQPEVIKAKNGELYFVKDSAKHPVCLVKNDVMRPLATWEYDSGQTAVKGQKPRPHLAVWIDRNGDGKVQPDEQSDLTTLADGSPLPSIASAASSLHMEPDGALYFTTNYNSIVRIPAKSFAADGSVDWDPSEATLAVPKVLPGLDRMDSGFRAGLRGVRLDAAGNIYTLFNARLKGTGEAFDYADAATATKMLEGMGHSAESNVVKFAKFDPSGKLLWMAGRKATAGAAPGEMYHFWNMAGLANDKYVAGGSEWGQIYIYTQDGFFVDALMNNPGEVAPPGPYTFGGETSGGRIAYFAQTGELWAYSSGMTYKVKGFSHGAPEDESRASGNLVLDKTYDLPEAGAPAANAQPLVIAPLTAGPLAAASSWKDVPASIVTRGGKQLASAQLGHDANYLYARIVVTDDSPLQNGATEEQLAFKNGDTAGIVLGPGHAGEQPAAGDVRFMAVQLQGQPKLIAMKAVTHGEKKPFEYYTPSSGKRTFEYVGEVPGAQVRLEPGNGGYTATFAVPLSFLEFDFAPGKSLKGDIEVRLSGAGARGLQAVSRNYLFTPPRAETTMVDDVPTEARMYPQYWGAVEVK